MNKLGKELKRLRQRRGLSAREAAKQISVSHPTVYADERTGKGMTIDRLGAYADLYGVSVATLARLSKKCRRKVQKSAEPVSGDSPASGANSE